MRKRIGFILALLAVFVLVMSGCASDSVDNQSSSSKDSVDVNVFQFKVEFKDQFEELVELYMKENEHVNLSVQTVGGGSDYAASLKAEMASGNEPVIFNIGGPTELNEYRDYLADLSDTQAATLALDGTLNGIEDGEEILGLPFALEGYGLIYNKEIFDQAGVDPNTLTSFAALEAAFAKIDEQKEALGLEAVVAFPASELWVMGNHLANHYIAPEFNSDIIGAFESETINFTYSDQMKKMLDLQSQYSVQPVLSLDYSMQVEQLFSTGKVAVIQQGNWIYPTVEQMDKDFAENGIGLIPMPFDGEFSDHLPVGVPQYWAVNKNASDEQVKAAKDFLDWMYTSDQGKDFVLDKFKFIPAYDGYDPDRIADPLSKTVYQYSLDEKTIGWTFMATPVGWNEDILATEFQKYLVGEVTWEEVLSTSKQEWENARK
ncbi:MAG: carbohydrate ABC transporter substrate-binding protein [Amphibacillus sp.]|nr:carbohydrate ABC transporter substrate-binding protein [Amphibacillus sp.]